MKLRNCFGAVLLGGLLASAGLPASAALQSIEGTHFNLQYDDTKLGLFGAPVVVGDTLYFTPNTFTATSANGLGVATAYSTVSGLVLTLKGNARLEAIELTEFGDYNLAGAGSSVQVLGQLRAFNATLPTTTQTASDLVPNPSTPLDLVDGANHNWSARARIDESTAALSPFFGLGLASANILLTQPDAIGLSIENRLTTYTDAAATGLRQAFIEKKFVGLTVSVSPVPLPPAQALFAAGLAVCALVMRRRTTQAC